MTNIGTPRLKYVAPRQYVTRDLRSAWVGNLEDTSALAIAYLIKRRMADKSRPKRIVFVDIDRGVYCARPDTGSVDLLTCTHPELVVGTYDDGANAADIAADLETHVREIG